MKYLNLGCGDRFHADWDNVDLHPTAPGVLAWNLRERTPYADETFDAVYHSHVLEHFPRQSGFRLLKECHRVLKPGGVVRVGVPALERIVRLYVEALEKASSGEPGWDRKHEWMVMEMFDQCVREYSGGSFGEYLVRGPLPSREFILEMWGTYGADLLKGFEARHDTGEVEQSESKRAWS